MPQLGFSMYWGQNTPTLFSKVILKISWFIIIHLIILLNPTCKIFLISTRCFYDLHHSCVLLLVINKLHSVQALSISKSNYKGETSNGDWFLWWSLVWRCYCTGFPSGLFGFLLTTVTNVIGSHPLQALFWLIFYTLLANGSPPRTWLAYVSQELLIRMLLWSLENYSG